jgi:hypothetical protein
MRKGNRERTDGLDRSKEYVSFIVQTYAKVTNVLLEYESGFYRTFARM